MTEEISTHFIHEKIEADLASNKIETIITRFPLNPMDTSISGMPKLFILILEPHSNTAEDVIFALMTPILPRKMNTMSMPSKKISAG